MCLAFLRVHLVQRDTCKILVFDFVYNSALETPQLQERGSLLCFVRTLLVHTRTKKTNFYWFSTVTCNIDFIGKRYVCCIFILLFRQFAHESASRRIVHRRALYARVCVTSVLWWLRQKCTLYKVNVIHVTIESPES